MNEKMREKLHGYNFEEHLDDAESIEIFLQDAFETNDPGYIANAIGVVAKSKGMAEIARKTGLSREQLYKSLSQKGNPTLKTFLSVLSAMDFEITPRRRAG